jgi:cell division protein FtsW (lipid II flippase)
VIDDREVIQKRVAYIDQMRSLHKNKRVAGFIGCLIGVLLMVASAYVTGAPSWLRYVGLAVVIPSWGLFVFVMISRARYVQTHPFDPEVS